MIDDAGNLSIDFLAGFTIFMISFIYVATLIPGLFIGLQSQTIDYDAVAYRTGVILVEDPGMAINPSGSPYAWETLSDYNKGNILRFGLALTKDTPNILSVNKIDRFFCSSAFIYPNDYRSGAVFGNYPYLFNISLQMVGDNTTQSIGDPLPEEYGYSRRIVKIKEWSNATIGSAQVALNPNYQSQANVTVHLFSVFFNYTELSEYGPDSNNPAYQINPIDPLGEGVIINLTELYNTTRVPNDGTQINLSAISIYRSVALAPLYTTHSSFAGPLLNPTDASQYGLYIDGNNTAVTTLPVNVTSNVSLIIPPSLLSVLGNDDSSTWLKITMEFDLNQSDWFLNSTQNQPFGAFEYNYDPANVTQPVLRDGVMEVAVW
jgi:hypothetical protein